MQQITAHFLNRKINVKEIEREKIEIREGFRFTVTTERVRNKLTTLKIGYIALHERINQMEWHVFDYKL